MSSRKRPVWELVLEIYCEELVPEGLKFFLARPKNPVGAEISDAWSAGPRLQWSRFFVDADCWLKASPAVLRDVQSTVGIPVNLADIRAQFSRPVGNALKSRSLSKYVHS